MPRGKKSAASAQITPLLPGAGRLAPPSELSQVEARIWRDVLDALPGHFVGPGGDSQVLRRVAAEGALAEDMERRIRELLTAGTPEAQKELAALTVTHTTLSKSLASLLGSLRATPKSRMTPRDAGRGLEPTYRAATSRPWDIKADGGEDPLQ